MTRTIRAVYQDGSLKPSQPLPLPDGTEVEVTVTTREPIPPLNNAEAMAQMVAEIAAIGPDSPPPGDGLCGSTDHDKILYGGPKGAL
jgi:predicted DNA-binding antitoxin AbrB/MazE fold protein